jgi:2-succinyl-5-enolpyruvyl-6-hydroxy-3-cyclohexene-1-carboxylate synthase
LRCAGALVAALIARGVSHFVVSSGSRCAPLVLAVGHHPEAQIWTNPDERSAGFIALGISRAARAPAALICTSGTAAANYLPAVVEARMSRIPLLVLTADRPPRLRGVGAAQTIDQIDLYGSYSLYCDDLPTPEAAADRAFDWCASAAAAYDHCLNESGPVHLNLGFDEPLIPEPGAVEEILHDAFAIGVPPHERSEVGHRLEEIGWTSLVSVLEKATRPVIVCGPNDSADECAGVVAALANSLGAPILADIASPGRRVGETVAHYDLFLRDPDIARTLQADFVLRMGGLPTSKTLNEWLASLHVPILAIAPFEIADPWRSVTHPVEARIGGAILELERRLPDSRNSGAYRDLWTQAEAAARHEWQEIRQEEADTLSEIDIPARVIEILSGSDIIYLSSSMPIRWADMYAGSRVGFPRVQANRGANGIDGIISSAAGAAIGEEKTVWCVVGDLAFYHDHNGLWGLAGREIPLKIVLINNRGGGIFDHLPISEHESVYEPYVAMPHNVDFAAIARAFGVTHTYVGTRSQLSAALTAAAERPGAEIIEIGCERTKSHARHQDAMNRISARVRQVLPATA